MDNAPLAISLPRRVFSPVDWSTLGYKRKHSPTHLITVHPLRTRNSNNRFSSHHQPDRNHVCQHCARQEHQLPDWREGSQGLLLLLVSYYLPFGRSRVLTSAAVRSQTLRLPPTERRRARPSPSRRRLPQRPHFYSTVPNSAQPKFKSRVLLVPKKMTGVTSHLILSGTPMRLLRRYVFPRALVSSLMMRVTDSMK